MRKRLKLKQCIKVPFASKLYEGYEVLEGRAIIANVSVDKVRDMMADFIAMYDKPLFFFLELPGHLPEGFEEGFIDEIKKDVYYLDDIDREEALTILNEIGNVLCNDGLSAFGFGVLGSEEEIMFDHLNLVRFLGKDMKPYEKLLADYKIEKVDDLFTVAQAFDMEHPADFTRYEENGFSVFDIPAALEEYGMYLAEKRDW